MGKLGGALVGKVRAFTVATPTPADAPANAESSPDAEGSPNKDEESPKKEESPDKAATPTPTPAPNNFKSVFNNAFKTRFGLGK